MFAATAIGVSHLVQSTEAGAEYQYTLLWAIIVANLLKYPFFEFGTRYALAKKKSIVEGYADIGRWAVLLFILLNFVTMFTVAAAVTLVTTGVLTAILPATFSVELITAMILAAGALLLIFGGYKYLEKTIKILALVLFVTSLAAFGISFFIDAPKLETSIEIAPNIAFVISLMGWMPTALDISTWNSIWTLEKIKEDKDHEKNALADFNIGYGFTAVMAIVFLFIGANLMYQKVELPDTATGYAQSLILTFTSSLGNWSYYIIGISALSIMFSTVVTVLDGYARVVEKSFGLVLDKQSRILNYRMWLTLLCVVSFLLISFFGSSLTFMVKLATIISFLIAPFIAVANLYLITRKDILPSYRPSLSLRILSIVGVCFLTGFSIYYLTTL